MDEALIENADETHFFNTEKDRRIGMHGQESIKYAYVVSGGEGITMMVKITGGVHAMIEAPMLIFQNPNCSYPIRGVSDDVPGGFYRSRRKDGMDRRGFTKLLSQPRAIRNDFFRRRFVLFVENCSGNNETAKTSVFGWLKSTQNYGSLPALVGGGPRTGRSPALADRTARSERPVTGWSPAREDHAG